MNEKGIVQTVVQAYAVKTPRGNLLIRYIGSDPVQLLAEFKSQHAHGNLDLSGYTTVEVEILELKDPDEGVPDAVLIEEALRWEDEGGNVGV